MRDQARADKLPVAPGATLGIEPDYLWRRLLLWQRQHTVPQRKHMRPVVLPKRLHLAA